MSELLPFRYTRYYESEMGADLRRRLVSFQNLIAPDTLPEIKLATNALENGMCRCAGAAQDQY